MTHKRQISQEIKPFGSKQKKRTSEVSNPERIEDNNNKKSLLR